jgi:hypothetical protein
MIKEIKRINKLIEAERFADADTAIKEAIAKYPDSPDLCRLQGELMLKMDKLEEASTYLKNLSKQEEDTIESNMLWLLGSPRSGSSWLAMQLLKHEGTICWNEPLIGIHLASINWEIDKKGTMYWNEPFILTHLANGYRETDKYSRYFDRDAGRPDYFFSSSYREIWKKYLRKMIISRLYGQYPDALHKKVVIKEPNGSFAADIIMQTLSNSKMVFLLRDGRDIIDSTLDMYKKGSWAQEWVRLPELDAQARKGLIIRESIIWRQQTEIVKGAFQNQEADKRLLVKYEDLRLDTITQLKKVYAFIGIPVSDEELRHIVNQYSFENIPKEQKGSGKVTRKAKPGGYNESFSEEEIQLMNDIMGDRLREFGYEE